MCERTNERLEIITRKLGLLFSSSNLGEEEERITWVQSNIFNSTTNKRAPLFLFLGITLSYREYHSMVYCGMCARVARQLDGWVNAECC